MKDQTQANISMFIWDDVHVLMDFYEKIKYPKSALMMYNNITGMNEIKTQYLVEGV